MAGYAAEGLAVGDGIFLYNTWKAYNAGKSFFHQAFVLNHEIGHVLGLSHTDVALCDEIISINEDEDSNNVMYEGVGEYNTAYTPCQVNFMYNIFLNTDRLYYQGKFGDPCLSNSTPHIIPSGTDAVLKTNFTSDRHIVIENDASLTIHCQLNMPTEGFIKIKPGGLLRLEDGAKITSGCNGELWNGIQVFGNKQGENNDLQGVFRSFPNSIIENAYVGVSNPNINYYNNYFPFVGGGGIINLWGTTFLNNINSVNLYPYVKQLSSGFISPYAHFEDCNFITNNDLYANPDYPIQVFSWGVKGPNMTNCNFINENTSVTALKDLGLGVLCYGCGAKFEYFDNISGEPATPRPIIEGYHRGFVGYDGLQPFTFSFDGYDFRKNVVGIVSMGVDMLEVKNCKFEVGGLTLPYNIEDNDFHEGIAALTGGGHMIHNNEFIGVTNPPDPFLDDPHKIGVRILNSGRTTTTVYNNKFTNLRIANKAEGLNRDPLNNFVGLNFKCNENENALFDFAVQKILPEDGILFDQGAITNPAKNTFTLLPETVAVGTDFYNGTDYGIQYWHTSSPNHEPLNYYKIKNFIPRLATGPVEDCLTIGIRNGLNGNISDNIDSIADEFIYLSETYDSLTFLKTSLVDENNTSSWINKVNAASVAGKAMLMNQLASIAPYTSDTLLGVILNRTNYFTNAEINIILNQNIHFYLYPSLKSKLVESWSYSDSTMLAIFNTSPSEYIKLEAQIANTNSNRFLCIQQLFNYYSSDSTNLDSMYHWLNKIDNLEFIYIKVELAMAQGNVDLADSLLMQIRASFSFTSRMDSIHNQYIQWKDLAQEMKQLNQDSLMYWIRDHVNELEQLADNTISQPAAFARGLLYLQSRDYEYFWYPLPIEEIITPRSQVFNISVPSDNQLKANPNPIENQLVVEINVKEYDLCIYSIYNGMGALVGSGKLENGNMHTIDTSELPAGIYYLSVVNNNTPFALILVKID